MRALVGLLAVAVVAGTSCATAPAAGTAIKVGAVFPLSGPQAPLARQEYLGTQIARDLVNADGGARGRRIELVTREITAPGE
ncbi:MAG TPA: ABC transporter substrate-binding protein, partial [Candidatus Dormibacteraeota bacterium]|nr:ABC transporter substrate-binding protein [Candidatus Dormibacteraeota bacterium]